jgi:hypothetical protein
MAATATWLIIAGFLLLATGFILRTILMMRASDAAPSNTQTLHGRQLVAQYRRLFPRSSTPLITRWALISGTILLLSGLCVQYSR